MNEESLSKLRTQVQDFLAKVHETIETGSRDRDIFGDLEDIQDKLDEIGRWLDRQVG